MSVSRSSTNPSSARQFTSRIDRLTTVGSYDAVIPRVAGQAFITEISQVGLDPADPYPTGYTLSDTWPATPPSD